MNRYKVRLELIRYYTVDAGNYEHAEELATEWFFDDLSDQKLRGEITREIEMEVREI